MSDTTAYRELTVRDLIARATLAHEAGDLQSYHHLVSSIAKRIEDKKLPPPKRVSGRTEQIRAILQEGYVDVAGLCKLTGLNPNRIHIALTTLRKRGYKLKSKSYKRYHIDPI